VCINASSGWIKAQYDDELNSGKKQRWINNLNPRKITLSRRRGETKFYLT
jgi:hypothetical protein